MENRADTYCEVKQWLENLLKRRFAADSKALNKLSAIDMFYLCVEVYAGYNVKICKNDMMRTFLTADDIAEYICDELCA